VGVQLLRLLAFASIPIHSTSGSELRRAPLHLCSWIGDYEPRPLTYERRMPQAWTNAALERRIRSEVAAEEGLNVSRIAAMIVSGALLRYSRLPYMETL